TMPSYPLALADAARAEQFRLLGAGLRLFSRPDVWSDPDGIAWAVGRRHGHAFAVTWLGPGWVLDPYARRRRPGDVAARLRAMAQADGARHGAELAAAVRRVRLGRHAGRLLWAVHQAVLSARCSVVRLPDFWLAHALWGPPPRPAAPLAAGAAGGAGGP